MGRLNVERKYSYDTDDRVITGQVRDIQNWSTTWAGVAFKTSTYVYDDLGNRSSHTYRDGSLITYAHDKANRMTVNEGQTQLYDDAGNLTLAYANTAGKSYLYKYDHLNRMTAVYDSTGATRSATFTYDALGRRIEHINPGLATNAPRSGHWRRSRVACPGSTTGSARPSATSTTCPGRATDAQRPLVAQPRRMSRVAPTCWRSTSRTSSSATTCTACPTSTLDTPRMPRITERPRRASRPGQASAS